MATLQKIVLAIASSWNNEISSPAPQGNRALRNKTNALAERQEPTSAKTPQILNPIGKGIGKFWIPILLALATVLPTIHHRASQSVNHYKLARLIFAVADKIKEGRQQDFAEE